MLRRTKNAFASLTVGFIFILSVGCAGLSDTLPEFETSLSSAAIELLPAASTGIPAPAEQPAQQDDQTPPGVDEPEPVELAAAATPAGSATEKQTEAPAKEAPDEFFDPFAKKDDVVAGEESDPWEGLNSAVFEFNRKFDRYILKPVAKVYDKVVPDALEKGLSNFFHNARVGPRLINNILQLKIKGAGIEIGRLLINSTIGIAGFFDPAKNWFDLTTPDEDTGQTLGAYGVPPGPYLVLPLLPPLTVRDFFGLLLDFGADPINYFVFPTFEVDDWPSAIAHKNRDTTTIAQFGTRVEEIVNDRSLNLEKYQGVEEATVDLYAAVRNAYLQKRAKAIRE